MFKEIENELMSIFSDNPIEKIAHTPTKEIAKTMDLIYKIKFEDIERVYTEPMGDIIRMTVLYHSKSNEIRAFKDMIPINGKVYFITFLPSQLLDKNENNAITLSKAIISYIGKRITLLSNAYDLYTKQGTLSAIMVQAIPVITCAVIRQIYSGPSLPKIIYNSLIEEIDTYKNIYSEEGINSVLDLFDEDLGVSELLDSGFICAIESDDKKYPGIWGYGTQETKSEEE